MLPGTFEIIKFVIIIRNKTKFEHTKEHIISKVLNVHVEYFQFEYYFAFLNSINIKIISTRFKMTVLTLKSARIKSTDFEV